MTYLERREALVAELRDMGSRLCDLARECEAIGGGGYLTITAFTADEFEDGGDRIMFNNNFKHGPRIRGYSSDGGATWAD